MTGTTQQKSAQTGFTIIEVMIVLAIAGLVMLLVFLAVPTLQRNLRNTERKRDIAIIATQLNEYRNNHVSKIPQADCSGNPGPACDTVFLATEPLTYYEIKNVGYKYQNLSMPFGYPDYSGPAPTGDTFFTEAQRLTFMLLMNYYKCGIDANGNQIAVHTGARFDQIVAVYDLEAADGTATHQCHEF